MNKTKQSSDAVQGKRLSSDVVSGIEKSLGDQANTLHEPKRHPTKGPAPRLLQ